MINIYSHTCTVMHCSSVLHCKRRTTNSFLGRLRKVDLIILVVFSRSPLNCGFMRLWFCLYDISNRNLDSSSNRHESTRGLPHDPTWPHLRCDVGLEEGEYRQNCLCLAVLCTTIIMVHKSTSSSYRSVNYIGL